MIDPAYGVSFSAKQCRNFGLDPAQTLGWLLERGWRRFRLMSYWNEHEKHSGDYDFTELDKQIARITAGGGVISLCLGVKQPRWPEYHWPDWAWQLDGAGRREQLLMYVQTVVERYKREHAIVSYQLENEALLQGFGERIDIDRLRLQQEQRLVRRLDPGRPLIMSTSNGWGIPLRSPRPDMVGFSCYFRLYSGGRYHRTVQAPWLHRLRRGIIQGLLGRPVFIHELQCEPWGPTAIWKMSTAEQDRSMDVAQITRNIRAARSIGATPIDLWGGEWWYWRWKQGDHAIARAVEAALQAPMDEHRWEPVQ